MISNATGTADITVASIRSLQSGDRLNKFNPQDFKLVLVDEAHHIVAPGYLAALEHFKLREPTPDSPALVGVSATFSRFDGLRLGSVIDHVVYHKDYVDMIGEKWLSDVMFTTIKSKANLSTVRAGKDGDFQTGQLSRAVNTDQSNEITVKAWLSEAGTRQSTLVFCVDIKHVTSLTSTFRNHGIDARYITGATKKSIRGERLDSFKRRQFPVLLNCGVFTEGTDIPNIDCVLLARPTKSRNLLVQMIGRGMRLYPGKDSCHVIDMVASLETGIVTVPTLFGLDPSEIATQSTSSELRDRKERQIEEARTMSTNPAVAASFSQQPDISNVRLDMTHYDTVHDLLDDTSGERHVRALSQNAWVQVDKERYILATPGHTLTLETSDEADSSRKVQAKISTTTAEPPSAPARFQVKYKYRLPPDVKSKATQSKPRLIATATTLTSALHAADTFAASKFERIFVLTSSPWRKSPASDTQLAFLNGIRSEDRGDSGNAGENGDGDVLGSRMELLTADMITKGQAGDMITKIKAGARGRVGRMRVVRRKRERVEERVGRMRGREEVRVGPLEA